MVVFIDELVILIVEFENDDKKQSWEKVCGSILRASIHDAPRFVRFNDHNRRVEIKPEDKEDKGEHKILIELHIKSQKSFNVLDILVKLPISYIDENLKPFFLPALAAEIK